LADKKSPKQPTQDLNDDLVQEVRARIIQGEVGYRRPPREHQFKKGEPSPNPGGRPRRAAPDLALSEQFFLKTVLKSSGTPISIKQNGVASEMSSTEAVVESVKISAIVDRNARAQGLFADWLRQAEVANARDIRENNEFWIAYQSAARNLVAQAKERGEPEPKPMPHPDDIIADHDGRLRNIGPFDEISKAATEKTLILREALLLQAGLDERLMPKPEDGDPLKGPGTAFEFAKLVNRTLPPRLRADEFRMFCQMERYSRHPLRWLLKAVFTSWRNLGKCRKRGELFSSLGQGLTLMNLLITLNESILDGTPDHSSEELIAELILENRRFAIRRGWI